MRFGLKHFKTPIFSEISLYITKDTSVSVLHCEGGVKISPIMSFNNKRIRIYLRMNVMHKPCTVFVLEQLNFDTFIIELIYHLLQH